MDVTCRALRTSHGIDTGALSTLGSLAVDGDLLLAQTVQQFGENGYFPANWAGERRNGGGDVARTRKKQVVEVSRPGTGEAREHRLKLEEFTDSQIVQASLDGDSRAFSDLVRRYDQRLLNFVYPHNR